MKETIRLSTWTAGVSSFARFAILGVELEAGYTTLKLSFTSKTNITSFYYSWCMNYERK